MRPSSRTSLLLSLALVGCALEGARPDDGSELPYPAAPSTSVVAETLQDSTMVWRTQPRRVAADAPNVLIVLLDDVGFGLPDTFGGPVHTPTLSRLAETGIRYNRFHTTAICSPTRASLLTGRNPTRVGFGTIAERAADWDGYSGRIPRSAATVARVLGDSGYRTAAFGKWHNTPAVEATAMGPFDLWPTGVGFDHFYGFLAGETSQYEPRLVRDTVLVEPPDDPHYHLSEDLAERAVEWLHQHRALAPDAPFLMYWAPGAAHGPHQVFQEYADRYAGRFDAGWDALREEIFAGQLRTGFVPADAQLTPRAESMQAWADVPPDQRAFQTRLMEVFAGFVEHADEQAGRIVDALEDLGLRENTIVIYVFGDNGSSAEGQHGTLSELLAQNQIPNTVEQQLAVLAELGGLPVLGGPEVDSMYHAGWAWAGCAPLRHTKLIASHFGGTRNPLVISWPARIRPSPVPRGQFHHVVDIAPTLYELAGIPAPRVVDGWEQDPVDGISLAYTFDEPDAPGRKRTQFFDNNGSRGIYHDEWFACTFGPLVPWENAQQGLADWDSRADVWELYDLRTDFSQAHDLAAEQPEKLAELQALFLEQARDNQDLPIGGGLWTRLHPEDRVAPPYRSWTYDASTVRVPEFAAPGVGRQSNRVEVDLSVEEGASGVLYALGGASGGLSCYLDDGHVVFEYNLMLVERTVLRSEERVPAGEHTLRVVTRAHERRPLSPADVVLELDGRELARTTVPRLVPAAFSASESFDVGVDLGSPVSRSYAERRPFRFEGRVHQVRIELD